MRYVRNAWYVVAWSTEVGRDPVSRRVGDDPLVLFRTQDGTAVCLTDRCAHRGYPLSAGRVVDDPVECGYHGFTFAGDGACTRVPGQSTIPGKARVRAYPLHEKDGWVWVWTGAPPSPTRSPCPTRTG